MALGRLKVWAVGELLKSTDLNAEFDNLIAAILAVDPQAAQSITSDLLADGANPEVFFGELFADEVVLGTGLAPIADSGLTITISDGTAYILNTTGTPDKLIRVIKASSTVVIVPNNTVGFIDLGSDGTFDISTSAAGAAADHTRLVSFTTDATDVTVGPTDVADRLFLDTLKFPGLTDNVEWFLSSVTAGTVLSGITVRDSTADFNIVTTININFAITTVGVNGRDQGGESGNTWFALLLIADKVGTLAVATLLVAAIDFPGSIVLPSGYTIFRRIGWIRNDGASDFVQGRKHHNTFYYEDDQNVGSFVETGFTAKSLAAQTPPTCRDAFIYGRPTGGGSQILSWRETGSGAVSGHDYGDSNGSSGGNTWILLNTSQQCDFKIGATTHVVDVAYYLDDMEKES